MGLIFREQPISDFGIDAQFEIKDTGNATGRLIAAQIKTGPSYFKEEKEEPEGGFWYRPTDTHGKLWIGHSLPVVIVLCDLSTETCYYELVTRETCVPTRQNCKILVPKVQVINASNRQALIDIASPVAAATDYSIASEKDVSHAHAKRISLDIVLHPNIKAINKPLIGAVIRKSLKHGQESTYARNEISAKTLGDKPVDVVFGFVYLRDVDRASAAWTCRFQWISPKLEEAWRPLIFKGEPSGDGLVIDWNSNSKISKFMDRRRITKSVYLEQVDVLLGQLEAIEKNLEKLIEFGSLSSNSKCFLKLTEDFEARWNGSSSPPLECQRLDQAIQEILATVGNSGLIWSQRDMRKQKQVMAMMDRNMTDLKRLSGEVSFLRRDVR